LIAHFGTHETVMHPVRFDGERLPVRSAPPRLGEQTPAIVEELAGTTGNAGCSALRDA
jgi:crotonobetainyl-CoA:carnitine CoA-transferase CaiB-like acyl-CoA transferase